MSVKRARSSLSFKHVLPKLPYCCSCDVSSVVSIPTQWSNDASGAVFLLIPIMPVTCCIANLCVSFTPFLVLQRILCRCVPLDWFIRMWRKAKPRLCLWRVETMFAIEISAAYKARDESTNEIFLIASFTLSGISCGENVREHSGSGLGFPSLAWDFSGNEQASPCYETRFF